MPWFGVRCVIHHADLRVYEERLTLWEAATFDDAIALATAEVADYCADLTDTVPLDFAQAYQMYDEPRQGAEVYSLMRSSELSATDYLNSFFQTGAERTQ